MKVAMKADPKNATSVNAGPAQAPSFAPKKAFEVNDDAPVKAIKSKAKAQVKAVKAKPATQQPAEDEDGYGDDNHDDEDEAPDEETTHDDEIVHVVASVGLRNTEGLRDNINKSRMAEISASLASDGEDVS